MNILTQPTHELKEPFKLMNYGKRFIFPSQDLVKGLEELIIFTENKMNWDIPNGCVFVFNDKMRYNPKILKSDVGCGIVSAIIPKLEYSDNQIMDILKVIDEMNIHIGQGNHFIDFTVGHPSLRSKNIENNMVFLHSDLNESKVIPISYEEAKRIEIECKHKRREYLENMFDLLGINGNIYKDWVHNSVNKEEGKLIYRKGSINVNETDGVGALALNPIEGFYLYTANFDRYFGSMQHGTGRIGSKSSVLSSFQKKKFGIARSLLIGRSIGKLYLDPNLRKNLYETYNSIEIFKNNFMWEQNMIGYCVPELVVSTKK